jgi:predicted transcriptional regulator of viral defense system
MNTEVNWSKWLDGKPGKGKSFFTLEEAAKATGSRVGTAKVAMHRAMRDHRVAPVGDGFYIVVPLEFRDQGAPPYEWVVNARFTRLGRPYYLGILTAAMYHGASHQKPMEIQVVTDRQMSAFVFGGQRVVPVYRRVWPTPELMEERNTRMGRFILSCPELTLVDAVRYPRHAAGFDNIANLIKEMDEKMRVRRLAEACSITRETPVLQRLGWMVRRFGSPKFAGVVLRELETRRMDAVPLEIGNRSGGPVDAEFKVRLNYVPEPDI